MAIPIHKINRAELEYELQRGGKLVQYTWCVSAAVVTIKHSTETYLVRVNESPYPKALQWCLLTFFAGWWGIPWGPIYTIQSLWQNLRGGTDITMEVALILGLNVNWDAVQQPGNIDVPQQPPL